MKGARISIVLALAACLALTGCANTSPPQSVPVQAPATVAQSAATSFPVKNTYCDVHGQAPADLAKKAGYVQYARGHESNWRAIEGLKANEFAVSDAGKPLPIAYFGCSSERTPVSLAIVVDESASMAPKMVAVRQTLTDLINGLNACDEVMLIGFESHPLVLQPLTTNHDLIKKKFDGLKAYGTTTMYDALNQALGSLDGAHYQNRAILLITDGMDNASSSSLSEILAMEENRRVPIYAIGIGDPHGRNPMRIAIGPFMLPSGQRDRVDEYALTQLTKYGGGRVWIVPSVSDNNGKTFADAVAGVGQALASGYVVGVVMPANSAPGADPQFSIVNNHDAIVRATRETLSPTASAQGNTPSH
jgi:VWFA-related protein